MCGIRYPITTDYFYKQRLGKFGLMASCKKCANEMTYSSRRKSPEKKIAADKRYVFKHREKVNARKKAYLILNPHVAISGQRNYYKNHPEIISAKKRRKAIRDSSSLSDRYVKAQITKKSGVPANCIDGVMIDAERSHMKIRRLLKGIANENPK